MLDEVRHALADRYVVSREIGRGGMATVYLATEAHPHRQVAVKVLDPFVASAIGRKRFLREVRISSALTHPHIVPIYSAGEAAGVLYYVMPYVDGETVRHRLARDGTFPVREALRIAQQTASALAAAHEKGIVHRDVKPENILLADGHAIVADFGIAKALTDAGAETLTRTGFAVGTPRYMSPEQAAGKRVDGRADVYALGCVLFEMLFEAVPTRADHMTTEDRAHLEALPVPARRVLERALASDIKHRFDTAAEMERALRDALLMLSAETPSVRRVAPRLVLGGLVTLLAAAAISIGLLSTRNTVPAAPPRLVVLPFDHQGRPEDEYFVEGLTEEITARLAELDGLSVISRTSAIRYRDTQKTAREIAAELGVSYVLEGSVRWQYGDSDQRIRVTPSLIRARDDRVVWNRQFDRGLREVFAVQSDIAQEVAAALDVSVLDAERSVMADRPTDDLEAYGHYLRGVALMPSLDLDELRRAVSHFERATELDPGFAHAYASLARADLRMFWYYADPAPPRLAAARAAIDQAFQLRPDLTEAHVARGEWYLRPLANHQAALREFQLALDRQPNNADWLTAVADAQRMGGSWEEAAAFYRRAMDLDPQNAIRAFELGNTFLWMRRYPDAAQWLDRAVALNPRRPHARMMQAIAIRNRGGNLDSARAMLRESANAFSAASVHAELLSAYHAWRLAPLLPLSLVDSLGSTPRSTGIPDSPFPRLFAHEAARRRGRNADAAVHLDSARAALERYKEVRAGDPGVLAVLGWVVTQQGEHTAGVAHARQAVELQTAEQDAVLGPLWEENLLRVYVAAGMQEEAIATARQLLGKPSLLSYEWLVGDPLFAPMRDDSSFATLAPIRRAAHN